MAGMKDWGRLGFEVARPAFYKIKFNEGPTNYPYSHHLEHYLHNLPACTLAFALYNVV